MNTLRRSDYGKKRKPYKTFKLKKQWLLKIWKYPNSICSTFFKGTNEVIFSKKFRTLDELAKVLYMSKPSILYISKKMRFNSTIQVLQVQSEDSLESSSESEEEDNIKKK